MRRLLRWVAIALGALIALVLVLALVADHWLSSKYEKAFSDYDADAERNIGRFIVLRDAASVQPFFAQERPSADAGPWLNARIPWESHPETGELAIPKAVHEQLQAWGADWLNQGVAHRYRPLATSWMRQLQAYGRWNVVTGSPIAASTVPFPSMPIPYFIAFQDWSKLRLIEGVLQQDVPAAVSDTRQLAWLSYSSELLIGEMVGLAILKHELKLPPGPGVPLATADAIDQWRDLLWMAFDYANIVVPGDLYRRAFPEGAQTPGQCAALTEATGFALPTRAAIEGRFETRYAGLDRELRAGVAGCQLAIVGHTRATVPAGQGPLDALNWLAEGKAPLPVRRLPMFEHWVASKIGLIFAAEILDPRFDRARPARTP